MRWLAAAMDVLYPATCCGCGQRSKHLGFCSECSAHIECPASPQCSVCGLPFRTSVQQATVDAPTSSDHRCGRCMRRPPRFGRARACAIYDAGASGRHPLRFALHRYKYQRDVTLARPLAGLLTERTALPLRGYDVIVPVPLHLERLRWRGFNQAQLLAQPLARISGVPVDAFSLERIRPTRPQVELDSAERQSNVARAFRVSRPARICGRSILLVDDVYTTGATVNECARVLLQSGAWRVDVLVLARAILS